MVIMCQLSDDPETDFQSLTTSSDLRQRRYMYVSYIIIVINQKNNQLIYLN